MTSFITDKPVCLDSQKAIYGVSEGETAHISCRVDAFPEADVFSWSFNTSSGGMDLPRDSYTNQERTLDQMFHVLKPETLPLTLISDPLIHAYVCRLNLRLV